MRWITGIVVTLLGLALTVYSIPFGSYVALGAFLVGVAMTVSGIRLLTRALRAS